MKEWKSRKAFLHDWAEGWEKFVLEMAMAIDHKRLAMWHDIGAGLSPAYTWGWMEGFEIKEPPGSSWHFARFTANVCV